MSLPLSLPISDAIHITQWPWRLKKKARSWARVAELRDGSLVTHLCLSSPPAPRMQVAEESAILASQLHQMIIEQIIIPGPHFLCHEAKQK